MEGSILDMPEKIPDTILLKFAVRDLGASNMYALELEEKVKLLEQKLKDQEATYMQSLVMNKGDRKELIKEAAYIAINERLTELTKNNKHLAKFNSELQIQNTKYRDTLIFVKHHYLKDAPEIKIFD